MKDEPVVAFLKFTSCEKYAQDIINGKFYSNTVRFFRELEKDTRIRGQGDINELLYSIHYAKIQVFDSKTMTMILESNNASAKVYHQSDDDVPLICFVGIKESDLVLIRNYDDRIEYKLPFTDEEYAEMTTRFGDYCVLINPEALIKRIIELHDEHDVLFEPINYVVGDDLEKATAHFEGHINRFFFKDKDLEYQREYRLCIYEKMPSDHCFFVSPFREDEAVIFKSSFLKNVRLFQNK